MRHNLTRLVAAVSSILGIVTDFRGATLDFPNTNEQCILPSFSISLSQWNYIETKQSPADLAPRGASIEKFRRNSQWFIGPDFLWETETTWSKSNNDF
jgi:hypothetical protein